MRAGLERLRGNPNLAEISGGQVRGDLAVVESLMAACDTPPLAEDVLRVARRGVAQHLAELARPEVGDRLRQAIEDLASLGRREQAEDLSRLLRMAASGREPDVVALAELAEALGPVLREVLGGGEVVARRDLARLPEDLVDRRYTKRRLLELLAAWVDGGTPIAPASVMAVVDVSGSGRP